MNRKYIYKKESNGNFLSCRITKEKFTRGVQQQIEKISKLEGRLIEIMQAEKEREKRMKVNRYSEKCVTPLNVPTHT